MAPGLDDDLLRAMMESRGWEPSVGVSNAPCGGGSAVPTPREEAGIIRARIAETAGIPLHTLKEEEADL